MDVLTLLGLLVVPRRKLDLFGFLAGVGESRRSLLHRLHPRPQERGFHRILVPILCFGEKALLRSLSFVGPRHRSNDQRPPRDAPLEPLPRGATHDLRYRYCRSFHLE